MSRAAVLCAAMPPSQSRKRPLARGIFGIAYDSVRARTVLFGGKSNGVAQSDTWEWDGSSWTEISVAGPSARGDHVMAYDGNRGQTVLFRGITMGSPLNDTWEYGVQFLDDDDDGVPDADDVCVPTPAGEVVDEDGCSIAQLCPCDYTLGGNNWRNHGAYVLCVAHAAQEFVLAGLISGEELGQIVSAAARSSCGYGNN